MKKRFVSLLVALSVTLTFLPIGAVAAAPIKFTDGNLKYKVNADGQSVTVPVHQEVLHNLPLRAQFQMVW